MIGGHTPGPVMNAQGIQSQYSRYGSMTMHYTHGKSQGNIYPPSQAASCPRHWWATEERVDESDGRTWRCMESKHYVTDNFGDLVSVPA